MSKALANKVRLILVLALVMVVSVCAGMFAFAKAEAEITSVVEVNTLAIQSAELIVEGDDGVNGLQFTATMSADEYESLKAKNGYEFETGIIIAPAYYEDVYGDLDLDNLFGIRGSTIIYDWANYVDGEYVYNGDKVRVVNINANDWKAGDGVYTYSGAIVDIQDHNETVVMVGLAYLKDANGDYRIVSDYLYTSVALEIEKEYEDLDADQKAWVDANWTKFEPFVAEDVLVDVSTIDNDAIAAYELISPEIGDWEYQIPKECTMSMTDENGNVKVLESGMEAIDLTEENLRLWTITLKNDGVVVYTGKVDLYDSTSLSFLWNDEISLNSVSAITHESILEWDEEQGKNVVVGHNTLDYNTTGKGNPTNETIDGKDYVSYTASGGNGTWFAWKPLHSKEYYETWVGKGLEISATIVIDVSGMVNPDDQNGVLNQEYIFGVIDDVNVSENKTFSNKASIDDILSNWDAIVGCEWDKVWETRQNYGMSYLYNLHNGGKAFVRFDVGIDASVYANKGGDILVNLDEVGDLTAVDMTSYMDPAHVAALGQLEGLGATLVYEVKGYSISDTIEIVDPTAVDLSAAKHAAYVVTIKANDAVVYEATFDIYSESDEVVWAESLTENNVIVQYGVYTTGRAAPKGEYDYEIVTATTENPVEGRTAGQFIKLESEVSQNILVNVLPLHTQDYYREVVGNKNFVLYFKLFESDTAYMSGLGMNGTHNYGMYNVFSNYRAGGNLASTWEHFVMSLDNYLICEDADATYTGAYFDLSKVGTVGTKDGCMMQVEVQTASADGKFLAYIGDFQITTGYETLMTTATASANSTSVHTTNLAVDLEGALTYDLRGIFNEISKAKYDYYISVVGVDNNGRGGNPPIYWKVTFGDGSTINVVANAIDDPATILDLTKEVSNGETVADKLNANSTITILAYAPNLAANGLASHPTYLASVKINFSNVPTIAPSE